MPTSSSQPSVGDLVLVTQMIERIHKELEYRPTFRDKSFIGKVGIVVHINPFSGPGITNIAVEFEATSHIQMYSNRELEVVCMM